MSTRVVADRKFALKIAKKYAPRIFQEFTSVFDLITPISTEKLEEVIRNFATITSKPTLNFGVREDNLYWYCYYLIYHSWDVNLSNPIKFIRKLDSHRHDTEAVLFRISKRSVGIDMITVNHSRFKVEKKTDRRVVIEREGHGIRPYSERSPGGNFIVYKIFDFFDLNVLTKEEWEALRKSLNGVSMPDEQYDSILRSSSVGRRKNKRGDIWSRPDCLFATMKLKGWLK